MSTSMWNMTSLYIMCFYIKILIYEGIHTWMSNHKSIHCISKKDVFFFFFLNRCFHNTSQFYKIRSLNQVGLNKVCCFNERIQIQSADLIHCKQNQ